VDDRPDDDAVAVDSAAVRLTAFVRGDVQGVGFRWWARARALELGLTGHATNLPDGRVQVVAEGERPACQRLLQQLTEQPSTLARPGRVTGVSDQWTAARGTTSGFVER
jgi:acylphosphatase